MKLSDEDISKLASNAQTLLQTITQVYATRGTLGSEKKNCTYSYRVIEILCDSAQTNLSFAQLRPVQGGVKPLPYLKWPSPRELNAANLEECAIVAAATDAAYEIWRAINGSKGSCRRLIAYTTKQELDDNLIQDIIVHLKKNIGDFLIKQPYHNNDQQEQGSTRITSYVQHEKMKKESAEKEEHSI